MAWYIDESRVKKSGKTTLPHWNEEFKPGQIIAHSGIYRCTGCDKEIACNAMDPFPPQNHHQHTTKQGDIRWKLLVKTE